MPNSSETFLLSLLSCALFEAPISSRREKNGKKLFKNAVLHSVAPLVFDGLTKSDALMTERPLQLEKYVLSAYQHNCRVFADHTMIHALMAESGIPYCILKGVASALYYPKPDLRMMGDVDFYVSPSDIPEALRFFSAKGFRITHRHTHHIVLENATQCFELHFALPGLPRDGAAAEAIRRHTACLLDDARVVSDRLGTYRLPSDIHHGIILLLHIQQHLFHSGIGLRHLCDYAVFLDRFTNEEFLTHHVPILRESGLLYFARILGRIAHRYLALPYRPWMGEGNPELEDLLLQDILDAGNFGRKDASIRQAEILMKETEDRKKHTKVYRLFSSINSYLCKKYKLFRKAPFLLPLGWLFYPVRFLFLWLIGKRKFKPHRVLKIASGSRKKLHQALNLFITDTKEHPMFNPQESNLLTLLSRALFRVDVPCRFSPNDYSLIFKEAVLHSVAPLALDGFEGTEGIPQKILKAWQKYALLSYQGSAKSFADHATLHNELCEQSIPYCILKGVASARYYPKPDLRMMGDVDFYVAEEDIPRTLLYFKAQGFPKPTKCNHHYGLDKDGRELELHFALPGTPKGEKGKILAKYTQDLLQKAVEVKDAYGTYLLPSDFHHGLILILHMQQHVKAAGIGLRHLCDYAVFLDKFTDEEFKALFFPALKDLGLLFFAQVMARVAHRFLSLPYRAWMGDGDTALEDRVIEEILAAGNFGQKDDTRIQSGFLTTHISDGKKHGLIYRLFAGINTYLRGKYKLFRKLPFLLPLGWPIYFVRYFFLLLRGKRKLKLTKIAKNTKQREALHRDLHLFE